MFVMPAQMRASLALEGGVHQTVPVTPNSAIRDLGLLAEDASTIGLVIEVAQRSLTPEQLAAAADAGAKQVLAGGLGGAMLSETVELIADTGVENA